MKTTIVDRNHVRVYGQGERAMVFAHGFGCDQAMWRYVAPAFMDRYRVVLFDHVGAGNSDLAAYDAEKYSTLAGYAGDVVEICDELGLRGCVFVGHSVSAMIGVLAAKMAPGLFSRMVMVGPSPSYINDGDYVGGFARSDIEELLAFLDSNHLGWSTAMGPVIMGRADHPEFGEELTNSFCYCAPRIPWTVIWNKEKLNVEGKEHGFWGLGGSPEGDRRGPRIGGACWPGPVVGAA